MAAYLAEKEREVFDMLGFEWNEDEARQAYIEEGMEQGMAKGRLLTLADNIKSLAESGFSYDKAMDMLKVPAGDRPALLAAL